MRLAVDIESNGLLDTITKIHCAAIEDIDSSYSEFFVFKTQDDINRFLEKLNSASTIVGHNLFGFDLIAINRIFGWAPTKLQRIEDTYVLGQLLYPDLYISDEMRSKEDLSNTWPGKVFSRKDYGSQGLKAWGQRVHCYKGEYTGGWEEYNDEMGAYNIGDTKATKYVFKFMESVKHNFLLEGSTAIDDEYALAPIIGRIQAKGIGFDSNKAQELISFFVSRKVELAASLREIFKPRWVSLGSFIPKRNDKSRGYVAGAELTKIELEEYNPSSRAQTISRLINEFDWNPEEFTDKGNVKFNEDIIENLPFKELQPLKEYLTICKRISQIEGGAQAWIKKVKVDGRIHGGIKQNGTVTGRASHFSPNISQVVAVDSQFGAECRELFVAHQNKVLIGCDADSLEMRCLAGYLVPFDKGRFRTSVLRGKKEDGTDPHTINMLAYDITDRDCAKTEFYGDIYGSKNAKKGKILMEYGVNLEEYVPDFEKNFNGIMTWAKEKKIEKSPLYWKCWIAGKQLAEKFGDQIPEIGRLREKIGRKVKENGYIKGLDGRMLFMRSEHSQLNTVLQSAGALMMKRALVLADKYIQEKSLTPDKDYEFVIWSHDEFEVECVDNSDTIDIIKECLLRSIEDSAKSFNFPCELKGNVKCGKNWREVH